MPDTSMLCAEPAVTQATKEVDCESIGTGPQGKPLARERVAIAGPGSVSVTEVDLGTLNDATRNVVLLAANTTRRSAKIENQSELVLLIGEGTAAKVNRYSYRIEPGETQEIPFPACSLALNGMFLGGLPSRPVLITERS